MRVFATPLKEPFITALGRQSVSTNVGLELRLRGGARGYGEASGSIVAAHLKPEALAAALKDELRRAIGEDVRRLRVLAAACWRRRRRAAPAAAAFECALSDALARAQGLSLSDWYGGALESVETDFTLSAAAAPVASRAAARAWSEGFRCLKVKVGTGPAADLERVEAIRRAAPKARLILDGNQGFSPAAALKLAELCARRRVDVVLFEQPVARDDLKGMAWLRRRSPFPIAADESVRSAQEAFDVLDREAADVINVKVAKTGLQESLAIVALARAAGKRLMIGCMRETLRGLAASAHLACGTGAFSFVDLDSDHLIAGAQPAGDFVRRGRRLVRRPRRGGASRSGSLRPR